MTAFCVYGVSMANCRKTAEKSVKKWDVAKQRDLTVAEWGDLVRAKALELFNSATRQRQISPAFDTPDFCQDWLNVSKQEEVRLARVMVRGPKMDKKGNRVTKSGVQVMTWVSYTGKNAFATAAA